MSGIPGNVGHLQAATNSLVALANGASLSSNAVKNASAAAYLAWSGKGSASFSNAAADTQAHLSQIETAMQTASVATRTYYIKLEEIQLVWNKAQAKQLQLDVEIGTKQAELRAATQQLNADNAANAAAEQAAATKSTQAAIANPLSPFPAVTPHLINTAALQATIAKLQQEITHLQAEIKHEAAVMDEAQQLATQISHHYAGQLAEAEKLFPDLTAGIEAAGQSSGGGGGFLGIAAAVGLNAVTGLVDLAATPLDTVGAGEGIQATVTSADVAETGSLLGDTASGVSDATAASSADASQAFAAFADSRTLPTDPQSLASVDQWLNDINPLGGQYNCQLCARAVDSRLAGDNQAVAGVFGGDTAPGDVNQFDAAWGAPRQPTTFGQLEQDLRDAGPGARAIVHRWVLGEGHTLNVVNNDGVIQYIDGQNGSIWDKGFSWLDSPKNLVRVNWAWPP